MEVWTTEGNKGRKRQLKGIRGGKGQLKGIRGGKGLLKGIRGGKGLLKGIGEGHVSQGGQLSLWSDISFIRWRKHCNHIIYEPHSCYTMTAIWCVLFNSIFVARRTTVL